MVALGALKEQTSLSELPMNEIQVHLLDKDGDGVVLCLEYETSGTGERINKTFHNTEDAYYDEEDDDEEQLPPHYYGEHTQEELDACASPENIKEFLKEKIEETISEEYDEIFHNSSDDEEPPPLLN